MFAFWTAETGIGVVGGIAVAAHGTDVAVSGFRKLWSGESTRCNDSLTSQGLQAVGMGRGWANLADSGISIVGTGTILALARGATIANGMVKVTRWGRSGLKSGDWVMRGPNNSVNRFLSGKWQPSWVPGGNTYAPGSTATEFVVPRSSLKFPSGWQRVKDIIGQRIYIGPDL